MTPTRFVLTLMLLLPLLGCGSDGAGSADTERPYKVAFTNDTDNPVEVVGCPDCGPGYELAAGEAWGTSLDGGETKVRFERDGNRVGCIKFINGVLPDDDDPPSVVNVSEYVPCRQ
jgi:hypothetical protein